jgi:hypothetical protein
MLILVGNLRDTQAADSSCCQLSTLFGAQQLVYYDNFGVLGRLLPSGYFEPELPELLRKTTPVTVIQNLPLPLPESPPHVRVDASHLRRGYNRMQFRSTWRTLLTRCYPNTPTGGTHRRAGTGCRMQGIFRPMRTEYCILSQRCGSSSSEGTPGLLRTDRCPSRIASASPPFGALPASCRTSWCKSHVTFPTSTILLEEYVGRCG